MSNTNYTFTETLGAGPSNPNDLTMLLPKNGYHEFDISDNRLIPILDTLIETSIEKANLFFDGCCVGHVELELYHPDMAIFGRVVTMNGETLFIKLLSDENPTFVMEGGLKYYPQFKDIYNCGEYPGVATGAFFKREDIFSLNIKSLNVQSSIFHVDSEQFAENYSTLEEFFIEPNSDGYVIAMEDRKLCSVKTTQAKNILVVSIRLIDLLDPSTNKLLKAMGFNDDTKVEHQFFQFVQSDELSTTLGQYKDFIRQHVVD